MVRSRGLSLRFRRWLDEASSILILRESRENFERIVYKRAPVPVDILRENGSKADSHELGRIAIKLPLPPGCISTLFEDDDRFKQVYFSRHQVSPASTVQHFDCRRSSELWNKAETVKSRFLVTITLSFLCLAYTRQFCSSGTFKLRINV